MTQLWELGIEMLSERCALAECEVSSLRALNAELVRTLEWLNQRGGLGLDVHAILRAAIAKAKGEA